jgi:hypothetical protein
MEASATVEPAPMEASKTGAPTEGAGSRKPTMIEPAEGAGTHATRAEAAAVKIAAVKVGSMAEARRTKVIAIDDRPAM